MDTTARGRRKKRGPTGTPGTFRPGVPTDTYEVMRLFAIAARAVCLVPEQLDEVTSRLVVICRYLVPPEATAALECQRLWQLFARVAQLPKETLRREAGRAFCRDIDTLGQRLDLPPLADWEELPQQLDEPDAPAAEPVGVAHDLSTLATVRERARQIVAAQVQRSAFPAAETAKLVSALNNNDRRQMFEELVGKGLLGRADVNLLIRFLVKGDDLGAHDTMLVEVLERLGRWLAQ